MENKKNKNKSQQLNKQDSNSIKQQLFNDQQQQQSTNNNGNDNYQQQQQPINENVNKPQSRRGSLLKDPAEYNKVVSELIKTLQQREIFTLKEIYKNEFSILKHTDKCYRLRLSFILPVDRIGLSQSHTSLMEDENFEDYCTVSKLPPIYLTFKYNDSYPLLSSVEYFKLDCDWLTENCLTTLSNQLITLWTSNINLPIISIWANWLKNESLFFLNLYSIRTTKTVIPKSNDDDDVDDGGGNSQQEKDDDNNSDFNSDDEYYEESILNTHYSLTLPPIYINHVFGQDPISYLVDWDLDNDHSPNNNNQKICVICKSNNLDLNFVNLYNCNHDFCEECLSAYISLNIEEDTLDKIVCPEHDCQVFLKLSPFEIRGLVSSYTFDLYLERLTYNNNNYCCNNHHDCDQVLKLLKDESINEENFYDAINQNCNIISHNHNHNDSY